MTTTMKQELQINQAIEAHLNEQLREMKKWLDETQIWQANMEVHQTQNVLATAQDTSSVEVVKNYIRYQIGRDNNGKSWRKGTPVFGEQLISKLDGLHKIAQAVVPTEAADREQVVDKTWMKLTRLYLGYMHRYFYYQKRNSEKGRRS